MYLDNHAIKLLKNAIIREKDTLNTAKKFNVDKDTKGAIVNIKKKIRDYQKAIEVLKND